jgi:hypothetical protein
VELRGTLQGCRSVRRIGFYPCCYRDTIKPAQLLREWVDELIFSDTSLHAHQEFEDSVESYTGAIERRFIVGDWRETASSLGRIDLLFYRNDSEGEGGSGISALSREYLPIILGKMPEVGYIVSDLKYDPDKLLSVLKEGQQVEFAGAKFALVEDAKLQSKGLYLVRVEKIA